MVCVTTGPAEKVTGTNTARNTWVGTNMTNDLRNTYIGTRTNHPRKSWVGTNDLRNTYIGTCTNHPRKTWVGTNGSSTGIQLQKIEKNN